jgi:GNAT superfamily N-acetyltransferase
MKTDRSEVQTASWRALVRSEPCAMGLTLTTHKDVAVTVRCCASADEARIRAFVAALSPRSHRLRFFTAPGALPANALTRICGASRRDHVVLLVENAESPGGELLGIGRLAHLTTQAPRAEFAVVVSDARQGQGVGAVLLTALIEIAVAQNLAGIVGLISADNPVMLKLARSRGFALTWERELGAYAAVLTLAHTSVTKDSIAATFTAWTRSPPTK